VSERLFPSDDHSFHDSRATTLAAELAEELLDELSRSGHSWRKMSGLASQLAELTARMARMEAGGSWSNPEETLPEDH
jgi:hypothetical protein